MPSLKPLALLPLALGCAAVTAAELGQADLGSSGVMVSSCAGLGSSGFPTEGNRFGWLAGQFNCTSAQGTTPGQLLSASDSYAQASPSVLGDAHGTAQYGAVGMYAHFRANANAGFAASESTVGWTDTLTLAPLNPAQMGQDAVLSFSLHLDGQLVGLPTGNSYTRIGTQVWLNDTTQPSQRFRAQGQGQAGFPFNQLIDQDLSFQVTVQLGTPFELGVFSRASVGTAGAGPDWFSEATSDFSSTLTWQGISSVTVGGNPITYTLSSQSGIDWTQAYAPVPVPEPSVTLLLCAGLAGLLAWRQRAANGPCLAPLAVAPS